MEEFLKREGSDDGQFTIPEGDRTKLLNSATGCDKKKKSTYTKDCLALY